MKNKKILIIALFLILFCLLGYSKSFASSIPDNMEGYGDSNKYFVIFKSEDERIFLVSFAEQANSNDGSCFWGTGECIRIYEYVDNIWVLKVNNLQETVYDYFEIGPYRKYLMLQSLDGKSPAGHIEVVGSNYDIMKTDDNSEIFFPKTPLANGIVAQTVEKVEMSQVLVEIIALLPTILVVLVSLVGLRKGLKMLETFLRQS